MATARVLFFKGGARGWPPRQAKRAEAMGGLAVHTQDGAYTRWCTHQAMHTQGGLWPLQESCYLRGVRGLAPVKRSKVKQWVVWRSTHKTVHTQGGARTRRCPHKAVYGHRRSLVI